MTSNIIEFSKTKVRRLTSSDKRTDPRLDTDDRLFAQIVQAGNRADLAGVILSCVAVNMSAGGIQFRSNESIPVGAELDLWVDVSNRPGKFFLAGEVRWSRPTNEKDVNGLPLYFIGVQLKAGAATDFTDWRTFQSSA